MVKLAANGRMEHRLAASDHSVGKTCSKNVYLDMAYGPTDYKVFYLIDVADGPLTKMWDGEYESRPLSYICQKGNGGLN